jgi:hypothetical protein
VAHDTRTGARRDVWVLGLPRFAARRSTVGQHSLPLAPPCLSALCCHPVISIPRPQTASSGGQTTAGCRAFVVPLSSSALGDEAAFLSEAVSAAAAAGSQGRYVGVLAAQTAGRPRSRRLQASPTPTATPAPIYMLPEITTGLLIGLLMIGFTGVGLSCVMGIKTPDIMHSTVLPAGKEY